MKKLYLLSSLFLVSLTHADYDQLRNNACPDAWQMHQKVVPQLSSSNLNPWGVNTNDKRIARNHHRDYVDSDTVTIDVVSASADDKVNDLLTVASECLIYRSHIVKGDTYKPESPPVESNPKMGWLPATF